MPFALREIEGGTGARRGTPTTNPVSHFQLPHPVVGAIRESPVPPQREPPIPPPSALADPRTRHHLTVGATLVVALAPSANPIALSPSKRTRQDRSVGATLVVALPPFALRPSKGTPQDRSAGAILVVAPLPFALSPS